MWVAAGAKYLPDPPRPAKVLRMLEDNGIAAPGMERRGREERRVMMMMPFICSCRNKK